MDQKELLHSHLRTLRADLLGKLDGLGEYDARRPLTRSGTNLLGLVKHVAGVQMGYFGEVFGRPSGRAPLWTDVEPDADMWAAAHESRASIVELHEFSGTHSDATVDALGLDDPGAVPWWPPERRAVTLGQILVHMIVEIARHAGHADIVRESIDGGSGRRPGDPNVPGRDEQMWAAHRARIEAAAREAAGR